MVQRTRDPRLADEALRERRVAGQERRELLERNAAPEHRLSGEVHDGHAATPDLPDDPIRTNLLRRHGRAPTCVRGRIPAPFHRPPTCLPTLPPPWAPATRGGGGHRACRKDGTGRTVCNSDDAAKARHNPYGRPELVAIARAELARLWSYCIDLRADADRRTPGVHLRERERAGHRTVRLAAATPRPARRPSVGWILSWTPTGLSRVLSRGEGRFCSDTGRCGGSSRLR